MEKDDSSLKFYYNSLSCKRLKISLYFTLLEQIPEAAYSPAILKGYLQLLCVQVVTCMVSCKTVRGHIKRPLERSQTHGTALP